MGLAAPDFLRSSLTSCLEKPPNPPGDPREGQSRPPAPLRARFPILCPKAAGRESKERAELGNDGHRAGIGVCRGRAWGAPHVCEGGWGEKETEEGGC